VTARCAQRADLRDYRHMLATRPEAMPESDLAATLDVAPRA